MLYGDEQQYLDRAYAEYLEHQHQEYFELAYAEHCRCVDEFDSWLVAFGHHLDQLEDWALSPQYRPQQVTGFRWQKGNPVDWDVDLELDWFPDQSSGVSSVLDVCTPQSVPKVAP